MANIFDILPTYPEASALTSFSHNRLERASEHRTDDCAIKALKDRNIPAEAFTLNAYAAVEVIKAGIEKAGKADDAEAVAAALKSGEPVSTAIGKLTYGENGDLTSQSFTLYTWQDGKIVPQK